MSHTFSKLEMKFFVGIEEKAQFNTFVVKLYFDEENVLFIT